MTSWSLPELLTGLHEDIQQKLEIVRRTMGHPGTKGDSSENVWLKLLQTYLPARYQAAKAHVVDSKGNFSDQIDVVVFDRQYSPFIFNYEGQTVVPAESVYAIFEAKQSINADHISYSKNKVESVRKLYRTSLPIPYAKGTYPPKPLIPIIGGVLTFESDWKPPFGKAISNALNDPDDNRRLNLGCVAAHGYFYYEDSSNSYQITPGGKPATAFLFRLISQLQFSGTVPMIDVQAYADWLTD